jgi:hypothetical protein
MDARKSQRHLSRMPIIEFDDAELAIAVESFRRLVGLAIEDSKRQTNPDTKRTFMVIAQRHQDTVEKLEGVFGKCEPIVRNQPKPRGDR